MHDAATIMAHGTNLDVQVLSKSPNGG